MRRMFKNLYLFVLTGVFVLLSWNANALSTSTLYTGYPCPTIRQFTDCVENYYLTGTGVGNDCEACPSGTGWASTSNVDAVGGWGKDTSCTCPKGYYNADDDTDQVVKGETCSLKPYKITYELDGGTNYEGAPATYTINDFVTFGTPTKANSEFVAWYTEPEFTNTITRIDRGSTGDITVWAKWTTTQYKVTFDKQDGVGGTDSTTVTYGEAMPSITLPTKENNVFNGYFDATTEGKQYYTDTGASAATWDKESDSTLYAQWTECQACNPTNATCELSVVGNKCTYVTQCEAGYDNIVGDGTATPSCSPIAYDVTYSCGEGTGEAPVADTANYGQQYTPKENTCTNENSLFQGWKVSGTEDIKQPGVGFTWEYQESKTFTAQWSSCQPCEPTNATCSVSSVNNECVYETACLPGYGNIQNNGKYNPSCSANAYEAKYLCGGVENPGAVEVFSDTGIYKQEYTIKDVDMSQCKYPGHRQTGSFNAYPESSFDSIKVKPGDNITWDNPNNMFLFPEVEICPENTNAPGTCDCEPDEYPSVGSCFNCAKQCSDKYYPLGEYNVCQSQTSGLCYRQCTTDDIPNSTSVSGTVTKGGVNTCEASSCEADYYLENEACVECPENAICDGGTNPFECQPGYHKTDDGKGCEPDEYNITLNKNGGTGTINGSTGTNDATQKCKHGESCSLPSDGLERTGWAFTGWGDSSSCTSGKYQMTFTSEKTIYACWSQQTTECEVGKQYNGSTHETCASGYYCTGDGLVSVGVEGCSTECPAGASGSTPGSSAATGCFKTCPEKTITGGTITTVSDQVFYDGIKYPTCTYKVYCDEGYVAENQNTANANCRVCEPGDYCPGGEGTEPLKCPDGGTSDAGATSVEQCYKTCPEPEIIENGTLTNVEEQVYYNGASYPVCTYTANCDEGYTAQNSPGANPTCVINDSDCPAGYYCEDGEKYPCPDGGTSLPGSTSINQCFMKCPAPSPIDNGTLTNVQDQVYYDGLAYPVCTYSANCDEGYIAQNSPGENPTCVLNESECPAGYYCEDGEKHPCPDGGTSLPGSTSITQCFIDCPDGKPVENGNMTSVEDKVYHNGTNYPECTYVITCNDGYSQVDDECIECPEDNVCTDGQQKTCAELTGNTHPHSDAGTTDKNMCYTDCPLAENAMSMTGRDYYGIPDTCQVERCLPGFYPDKGACVVCPEGWICDGTDPEKKSCADLGDGSWKYSEPGAKEDSDCYRICESYPLIGGTAIPINEKEYWPDECKFRGETDDGEPCEIIDDRCVISGCKYNQEMINGNCEPCNREHALSYVPGFNCVVASCEMGWHPKGQRCEEDIKECRMPNAVYSEQKWDPSRNAFGECIIKECEPDFHIVANACVRDTRPCEVENGAGVQYWNDRTNSWGDCEEIVCNPGYTSDSFDSAEPTKQCGRCKNMYSVLGEVAVSSYAKECEIASCLYQGELYNLDNNECVPICDINGYEDETGTMKWDPSRKKCVRTCKEGYSMW